MKNGMIPALKLKKNVMRTLGMMNRPALDGGAPQRRTPLQTPACVAATNNTSCVGTQDMSTLCKNGASHSKYRQPELRQPERGLDRGPGFLNGASHSRRGRLPRPTYRREPWPLPVLQEFDTEEGGPPEFQLGLPAEGYVFTRMGSRTDLPVWKCAKAAEGHMGQRLYFFSINRDCTWRPTGMRPWKPPTGPGRLSRRQHDCLLRRRRRPTWRRCD